MSILRESQSRNFLRCILALSILLLALTAVVSIRQVQAAKEMLLSRDAMIADSLLEQGISPDIIAIALSNTTDHGKGKELLELLGFTKDTSALFLPSVSEFGLTTMIPNLIGCVLIILSLFLICFLFLKSKERIYQQATKIIFCFSEGDFSTHLPRKDEGSLYQLFAAVDHLATALQAKSEAEYQARQFLKNTISDISHQLKTPLAALNIYNDIIRNEPHNLTAVTEFSQKTAAALSRMEKLIQSLLKFARLNAGSIIFEKNSYHITELVAQATEELLIRAASENKFIDLSGEQEDRIICDILWTSEAIGNIIKNGLDYIDSGGHVRIFWESTPIMVRISIADDGPGIAPEDLHHIFKRFYRSKTNTESHGIGLGLPLAKAIVEGQGGMLSVQSTQGNGTTFTISFLT